MKRLHYFSLMVSCMFIIQALQDPLLNKISSYYEPELKKAFEQKNEDRIINLYRLDPKLCCALASYVKKNDSEWGRQILKKVNDIKEERRKRDNSNQVLTMQLDKKGEGAIVTTGVSAKM